MTKNTVRFVVDLKINPGKLDPFQRIAQSMISASQKEPGTLGYDWYFSADRARCRLLETYSDQNAVLAHMNGPAVREGVPKLLELASVSGFEVYGDPGETAAKQLTAFGAEIFQLWQGTD